MALEENIPTLDNTRNQYNKGNQSFTEDHCTKLSFDQCKYSLGVSHAWRYWSPLLSNLRGVELGIRSVNDGVGVSFIIKSSQCQNHHHVHQINSDKRVCTPIWSLGEVRKYWSGDMGWNVGASEKMLAYKGGWWFFKRSIRGAGENVIVFPCKCLIMRPVKRGGESVDSIFSDCSLIICYCGLLRFVGKLLWFNVY